jgi:hypothetical protein
MKYAVFLPGRSPKVMIDWVQKIERVAACYTVVTYDRRGFSRSYLEGPQDYEHRLETDADDVRSLIEHLMKERILTAQARPTSARTYSSSPLYARSWT